MLEHYFSLLPAFLIGAIAAFILLRMLLRWRNAARAEYIRTYMFPPGLLDKLGKLHPTLALKDKQLVARALRQFFLAYLKSGRKFVAMPSQVADDLWHEFILYTRHYETFCEQAFGRFMHHTPAAVLGPDRQGNSGLRRVWWHACLEENINPRKATRLPLLFALDDKLNIANGFRYALDCSGVKRQDSNGTLYCGGDMSDASIDGTLDGFGDGYGDSGPGNSGSDAGDGGCGGGCGGGD
jgi:hypothetical protein